MRVEVTDGRLRIPREYFFRDNQLGCYTVSYTFRGRFRTYTINDEVYVGDFQFVMAVENGEYIIHPPHPLAPSEAIISNRVDGTYINRQIGRRYWECNRNRMPAIAAHLNQHGRVRIRIEGGNWTECETHWNANELNFRLYTEQSGTIYYDLIPLNQFRASRNEIAISRNNPLLSSTSSADIISIRRANTNDPFTEARWRNSEQFLIIRAEGDGEYEVQIERRNQPGYSSWIAPQISFNMTEVQERFFNSPWPSSPMQRQTELTPRQPTIERIDKELPRSLNITMNLGKFLAHNSFPLSASYTKITMGMRIISIKHIGDMIEYTAYSAKFEKTPTPTLYEMTIVDGVVKAKQLEETIRKERCLVVTE